MNIGLYNLKYGARKWIEWTLPFFRDINPNWISLSLLPFGAAAAYFYSEGCVYLGALCIFSRMFLGTLDGLVAERFQKGTPQGEILNRLTPELCDALLFTTLAVREPTWGIWALAFCWLTTFSGLIGLAAKKGIQSSGPAGQTDRLVALLFLSLLPIDFNWMRVFLMWCTLGGAMTVVLRLRRIFF